MPRGFSIPGKVLKLKRNLYGLKQAAKIHYTGVHEKLTALGFKNCNTDQCLYVSDKAIVLVYVDNTLFFACSQKDIDEICQGLKDLGADIEEETDVAGFLGVLIDRRSNGTVQLLQTGLIDRVIKALNINHLPGK